MPVACHLYKNKRVYLTGKRVAVLFREAIKAIHPMTSKANLSQYLAHLLRVWACVLLNKVGMSPDFIKSHLRWMGNSFWMYFRDTGIIQDKQRNILQAVLQEVIDLITGYLVNTPGLEVMSMVETDNTMGDYIEDMD